MLDLTQLRHHKSLDRLRGRSFIFGIGGQRCGSTWLASRFSAHPDIAFSEMKELQFFNAMAMPERFPGMGNRYRRLLLQAATEAELPGKKRVARRLEVLSRRVQMEEDPAGYFQYFADIVGDKPAFGEITPEYAFLPSETLVALRSLGLDIKVIYAVRNPVDRYISALSYYKRNHPKFNFRKALTGHLQNQNFTEHTSYHLTINKYAAIFDSSSFMWLYYEDLLSEQGNAACLKQISSFLNISDFGAVDLSKKVNTSEQDVVSTKQRREIAHHFKNVYMEMKKLSGGRLPDAWLNEMNL